MIKPFLSPAEQDAIVAVGLSDTKIVGGLIAATALRYAVLFLRDKLGEDRSLAAEIRAFRTRTKLPAIPDLKDWPGGKSNV